MIDQMSKLQIRRLADSRIILSQDGVTRRPIIKAWRRKTISGPKVSGNAAKVVEARVVANANTPGRCTLRLCRLVIYWKPDFAKNPIDKFILLLLILLRITVTGIIFII